MIVKEDDVGLWELWSAEIFDGTEYICSLLNPDILYHLALARSPTVDQKENKSHGSAKNKQDHIPKIRLYTNHQDFQHTATTHCLLNVSWLALARQPSKHWVVMWETSFTGNATDKLNVSWSACSADWANIEPWSEELLWVN